LGSVVVCNRTTLPAAGSSVNAGPAIVGNSVYWGSGYSHFGLGTGNTKLFAFTIGDDDDHH
jgi:polyvinyl alcohol dehydrogenase (cytochrome)